LLAELTQSLPPGPWFAAASAQSPPLTLIAVKPLARQSDHGRRAGSRCRPIAAHARSTPPRILQRPLGAPIVRRLLAIADQIEPASSLSHGRSNVKAILRLFDATTHRSGAKR
jgi:hypothetical protein